MSRPDESASLTAERGDGFESPQEIARPIDLPDVRPGDECPVTERSRNGFTGSGEGPVYVNTYGGTPPFGYPRQHDMTWYAKGWLLAKTPIYVDPAYEGPILIRGRRLDGHGVVRFDPADFVGGDLPARFFLPEGDRQPQPADAGMWFTAIGTAVPAPGCYGYQIDGDGFTDHIFFDARKRF